MSARLVLLYQKAKLMSSELVKRAEAKREWFRIRESVKGSGWHSDDKVADQPAMFRAPQSRGLPLCSSSLVYFSDTWTFRFVGDDVAKFLAARDHCCDDIKDHWNRGIFPTEWLGNDKDVLTWLPSLTSTIDPDGTPIIIIQKQLFNIVLWVLEKEKVGITGCPLVEVS